MDLNLALILGAAVIAILVFKRLTVVSASIARKHLQQGALLVDVRTAAEYRSRHLPGSTNIPLDELSESLPRRVPDRNRVLLLHCLSGTRSGIARRLLKGMGYANAHNLGSYGRAQRILNSASELGGRG